MSCVLSTPERFWERVNIGNESVCWEWLTATNDDGYGILTYRNRFYRSHCLAWILTFGEIPNLVPSDKKKLCVLHKCDNRKCCNPSHLFLGTQEDNNKDAVQKNRHSHGEEHGLWEIGEGNPYHKLTNDRVVQIRDLYASGVKTKDLADRFDVNEATIRNVLKRKTWKHV